MFAVVFDEQVNHVNPMIVYSSYETLNVYTKEGQMQERHSLTEFVKKQAA